MLRYNNLHIPINYKIIIHYFYQVETAVAHATTLTETDVGRETCHIIRSSMVENIGGSPVEDKIKKETAKFWNTSVGRFRFALSDLPSQLRLIHSILTVRINANI